MMHARPSFILGRAIPLPMLVTDIAYAEANPHRRFRVRRFDSTDEMDYWQDQIDNYITIVDLRSIERINQAIHSLHLNFDHLSLLWTPYRWKNTHWWAIRQWHRWGLS